MGLIGILSTFLLVLSFGVALLTIRNGAVILAGKTASSKIKMLLIISYFFLGVNYVYYNLLLSVALDNDASHVGGIFEFWHLPILALQLFLIIALQLVATSRDVGRAKETLQDDWVGRATRYGFQKIHLVIIGLLCVDLSFSAAL